MPDHDSNWHGELITTRNDAQQKLGYEPSHIVEQGLGKALEWYKANVEV